jgi:uncharacterized protein Yka (UPF0111/DUF47 family)
MDPSHSPEASDLLAEVLDVVEDLVAAARLLQTAFIEPSRAAEHARMIRRLEESSDATIRSALRNLEDPDTTGPLSVAQTITLLRNLDDAMDALEEAADFTQIYAIRNFTDPAIKLASFLRQAAEGLLDCMTGIRDGRQIGPHVRRVDELENSADDVYRATLGHLMLLGPRDPFFAIRWKDIYDRLEEAIDRCEEVAQFLGSISSPDTGR